MGNTAKSVFGYGVLIPVERLKGIEDEFYKYVSDIENK